MQITEAKIKRIFVVRLEEGEKLPDTIEALAKKKNIKSALVLLLGGARDGRLVVGPAKSRGRPKPMTQPFTDGHEVMGIGTIFASAHGPELHLHVALGRNRKAMVGCGRTGLRVNFIMEALILELAGLNAERVLDPATGFHLLALK